MRYTTMLALGLAAIDMLCCAFVATILLFLALLKPPALNAVSRSTGDLAVRNIAIGVRSSPANAVFALAVKSPRDEAIKLFVPERLAEQSLEVEDKSAKAARWLAEQHEDSSAGILIISEPMNGNWSLMLTYVGSLDEMRSAIQSSVIITIDPQGCASPPTSIKLDRPLDTGEISTTTFVCPVID